MEKYTPPKRKKENKAGLAIDCMYVCMYVLIYFMFAHLREREREQRRGRERETQNPKQAPGSELPAQSQKWHSNPQTLRS